MDIFFHITMILQTFVFWILTPFFKLRRRKFQKTLPKIKNGILKYSATNLAKKIRQKQLTCVEIIQAYIARIEEVNPILNAVVEDRFDEALKDAKNVDRIIASNELSQEYLAKEYPLLGVPVTVKESCKLEGMSYCVASPYKAGVKAEKDGDAVSRVKKAGAIPLIVSNTPELCLAWETSNLVTGRTLNPYDTTRTSAGSSGGEGALLGSGASVIGMGSDIAGSIRLPGMFNGIFGHKPTPKVISINGHEPTSCDKKFGDYLVIGPMTRYAEDLKLMMRIMADNPAPLKLDENVDVNKLNIFFMYDSEKSFVLPEVDREIKTSMKKCLDYLENLGCSINDYKFDMSNTCQMSAILFYSMEDIPNVMKDPLTKKEHGHLHLELLKSFFGRSKYSLHGLFFYFLQKHKAFVAQNKYPKYKKKADKLRKDFIQKLGDNGVLLYPTFPSLPTEHDKMLSLPSGPLYTMVFNILGLPATNVPLGLSKNGLPIGIQIVAAPYQDKLCFAVAEQLEKAFGGWIEP